MDVCTFICRLREAVCLLMASCKKQPAKCWYNAAFRHVVVKITHTRIHNHVYRYKPTNKQANKQA